MPYSRMTAAAHGNSSTKEKVKAETIPGFSHLFSPCQHLKTRPSQKSFHLSELYRKSTHLWSSLIYMQEAWHPVLSQQDFTTQVNHPNPVSLPFMQSSSWMLTEETNDTSNSTQSSVLPLTRCHTPSSVEVSSNSAGITVQLRNTRSFTYAHMRTCP